jgi:EAL domain-containing protein (putative c-di-GMP-specific phosphodiesterase class I)
MNIDTSDHELAPRPPAQAWADQPANRGVLLLDPPASSPIDDVLTPIVDGTRDTIGHDATGDTVRGLEVEMLRDRLVDLITGTGPGLLLQPVTHIQSGVQVGAEALARFPGSMTTAEWFRTAHAVGVGEDLELRILHEVVQRLDRRCPGFVGVNLSPNVLLDPRSSDILRQASDAELVVEITDQTAMPKLSVLRFRLDEVRRLGIRVAIHVSEFGLATMQLLMLARPDVIKLDPPITAAVAAGRARSATAGNMFRYCRQEGVFVVAVGVETRQQLEALQDAGVDAYQGFFVPGA